MMWRAYVLTAKNVLDQAKMEIEKYKEKVESKQIPDEIKTLNAIPALFEMKQCNDDTALERFVKSDTKSPLNLYYTAIAYEKKGDNENVSELFEMIRNWNANRFNFALVRNCAIEKLK